MNEPPILLVCDLPYGLKPVIGEGEKILVNLFDAESPDIERMVAERFAEEVESLKNETPDLVTSEGYTTRRRLYRKSYATDGYAHVGPSESHYYEYRNQLEALHIFFDSDTPKQIEHNDDKTFTLSESDTEKDLVLRCEISGRKLYFQVSPGIGSSLHPLRLIPVGGQDETAPSDPFDPPAAP